jgi:hypothetical protein
MTDVPRNSLSMIRDIQGVVGFALSQDRRVVLMTLDSASEIALSLREVATQEIQRQLLLAVDSSARFRQIDGIRSVRLDPRHVDVSHPYRAQLGNGQIIGHIETEVVFVRNVVHEEGTPVCQGYANISLWWTNMNGQYSVAPRAVDMYPCDEERERGDQLQPYGIIDLGEEHAIIGYANVWKDEGYTFIATFDGRTFRAVHPEPWTQR